MDEYIITLTIPNRDAFLDPYTICHKEVLQKSYQDKIGSTIEFCGVPKIVKDVRITDKYIYIDLAEVI